MTELGTDGDRPPAYSVAFPLVMLSGVCFFAVFFALNPGLMSYDSMVTWRMSGGAPMSDAHPPVYILLLQALRFLWDSPAVMVFFNVGVFMLGALLLGETVRRRAPVLGYLVPLVVILPFILNFIGLLWKDTALAVCWWAAASIAVYVHTQRSKKGWQGHALMCLAYALFLFGLLVRHNAVTGAPFLLLGLVLLHIGKQLSIGKLLGIFVLSSIVSLGSLKASSAIISHFYPVTKIDMLNDLALYDLAGITKSTGKNAFPVEFTDDEIQRAIQCYQLNDWNSYADPSKCLFVMDRHGEQNWLPGTKLVGFWVESIFEHPRAYAQHRLAVFGNFLRIGKGSSYYASHAGIDPNELGLVHPQPPLYKAFQAYIEASKNAFFMRPWFWLLLNIAAGVVLYRRRSELVNQSALAVAAAGAVYILTYLPFGIASDFRYAYWSIMAAVFSWSVIASELLSSGWRRRGMIRYEGFSKRLGAPASVPQPKPE